MLDEIYWLGINPPIPSLGSATGYSSKIIFELIYFGGKILLPVRSKIDVRG